MIWFHRTLWFCLLVFVTYVTGMSGGNQDWSEYFRRSLGRNGFFALVFLPFVYWEVFCRFTIPDKGRLSHFLDSLGRCLFILMPAHFIFACCLFEACRKFRVPLSLMEAFAVGIAFGCLCVVLFDIYRSWTPQKTAGQAKVPDSQL